MDKACVIGPYTPEKVIQATAGVEISSRHTHDIHYRDDITLLLFIRNGRVARSVAHPLKYGDFGPALQGKCFAPTDAVFRVRQRPVGSWSSIGPS